MVIKALIIISGFALLGGCSTVSVGPIPAGPDSYIISKEISAFSSEEDQLLSSILSQANEYCVEQQRYMEVKHLNEYSGFFGNETKTTLMFSCLSEKQKNYEQLAPVVIAAPTPEVKPVPATPEPVVEEPSFPPKNKLTNYAF
ncbi:hypothetical protein DS885_08205 [Psychromonas sp. B3M02]|uniref:hypothetical protein n=1 Tax=unclassified Psychromonas TaxID=2614957 RepID=UPI000DEAE0CD|nr:hypothetical protein [Psychromonas sp. B3M02]RBW46428.1 hypothetical protein DS885_08205 [Psychromonas sp. B3M02]